MSKRTYINQRIWQTELYKMNTKEKVIRESLRRVEKRLAQITFLLEYNCLSEIVAIRQDFKKLLENYKGKSRLTKEFSEQFAEIQKREEAVKSIHKATTTKGRKLIEEKAALVIERSNLFREAYFEDINLKTI